MPVRRQPDQRKPHQRRRRQIEPLQRGRLRRSRSARAAARPHPAPTDRSAATAPRPAPPRPAPAGSGCSCRKPARRLACRATTACNEASSTAASSGPRAQAQAAPCRRPVPAHRRAHGTADPPAAATAAGCPRSADTRPPAVRSRLASDRTSARSLGVRPPAPGCAAWRASAVSARNQVSRQIADRRFVEQRAGPGPVRGQPRAVRPIEGQRVDLDRRAPAASPDRRRHAARIIGSWSALSSRLAGAQSPPSLPAANRPR